MTIAVTGASGHIASSLIPMLIAKGHRVKALVNKSKLPFSHPAVEIIQGDLLDKSALTKLVEGCEVVIHTAAKISINSNRDPSVYDTNVNGTISIFNSASHAGVKRFLHISSIHAYNQSPVSEPLDENRVYCTDSAAGYDRSKRDAEKFILSQAGNHMEAVVLNPTAVVGPGDHRPSLMGQAIMDLYNNKVPMLIKGGFDFCDVRDVSSGIISAIEKGRHANRYLLSGKWHSLNNLHSLIMKIKGEKKQVMVLPGWAGYAGLPFINLAAKISKKEPLYTKESLSTLIHGNCNIISRKAAEELGYTCRPLSETMTDSINWFKQNGLLG